MNNNSNITNKENKQKEIAKKWFSLLQKNICKIFEELELNHNTGPFKNLTPGTFKKEKTYRKAENQKDNGGGIMAIMRNGRLFEKVGVNVSTVYGDLGVEAQKSISSRKKLTKIKEDPRFWASGISLVAHMRSPKVPAVHMNTRMFWTPHTWWFGGGSDLNPMVEDKEDTKFFHKILKDACDKFDMNFYPKYKKWADEYFTIKHWNEPRGVGGIFFDDHNTGSWENDFNFTKEIGNAFLDSYLPLINKHKEKNWTSDEREWQLIKRGKYAEFNLVYDRGTHFGLHTGHNPKAVLMSLPPEAKWP